MRSGAIAGAAVRARFFVRTCSAPFDAPFAASLEARDKQGGKGEPVPSRGKPFLCQGKPFRRQGERASGPFRASRAPAFRIVVPIHAVFRDNIQCENMQIEYV